jgi:hypothetical protein
MRSAASMISVATGVADKPVGKRSKRRAPKDRSSAPNPPRHRRRINLSGAGGIPHRPAAGKRKKMATSFQSMLLQ